MGIRSFSAPQGTRRCTKPAPGGMVEGRQFAIAKPKGDFAGANLIVLPEAFVGDCPKEIDFGARLGPRNPEGPDELRRYYESTIDVPGPAAT